VFVKDHGAGSAGADVDTEDWNTVSFYSETCARLSEDAVSDTGLVREIFASRNGQKNNSLMGSVNVHGGHLRLARWACQRGVAEKVISFAARLTSCRVEHTMPARKCL
jgi:hypothetical protein